MPPLRFSSHVHQVQRAKRTVDERATPFALDEEDCVSRRRGEITKQGIDRDWPHQVEVIATVCQGHQMDVVIEFCRPLSVAPLGGRQHPCEAEANGPEEPNVVLLDDG
jgi:hypothetical protein